MQRTRNWILAVAAAVILGGAALVAVGMSSDDGGIRGALPAANSRTAPAATPVVPVTPTGPSPEELRKIEWAKRVKALTAALNAYADTVPEFSVAVLDKNTGERFSFRGGTRYETASVVKVQVLACVLLEAQEDGRDLTSTELSLVKKMIRASDNNATSTLFARLDGAGGLKDCNEQMGLTETEVSDSWGLTKTTVNDQVRLLSQLVNAKGPLDAGSRKLAFDLMSTVADDQDWGVPVVGAQGERTTVKNGWLARSTDGGKWIINTVGRVTGGDTDVSIAVLSHNHKSMPGGIKVVEKAAKLTRQYLKY